jgi:hypothetical protein
VAASATRRRAPAPGTLLVCPPWRLQGLADRALHAPFQLPVAWPSFVAEPPSFVAHRGPVDLALEQFPLPTLPT